MSDPNQLKRFSLGRPTPSVNSSVAGILPRLRLTPQQDGGSAQSSMRPPSAVPLMRPGRLQSQLQADSRVCQQMRVTTGGQGHDQRRGLLETIKTVVGEGESGALPTPEAVPGETTVSLLDQSIMCGDNDTTVIGPPPDQRQSVSLPSGPWKKTLPGQKKSGTAPPTKKGVSFHDPLDQTVSLSKTVIIKDLLDPVGAKDNQDPFSHPPRRDRDQDLLTSFQTTASRYIEAAARAGHLTTQLRDLTLSHPLHSTAYNATSVNNSVSNGYGSGIAPVGFSDETIQLLENDVEFWEEKARLAGVSSDPAMAADGGFLSSRTQVLGDDTLTTPVTSLFPPVSRSEPLAVSFLDEGSVPTSRTIPETVLEEDESAVDALNLTSLDPLAAGGVSNEEYPGGTTFLAEELSPPSVLAEPEPERSPQGRGNFARQPEDSFSPGRLREQVTQMQTQLSQFREWEATMAQYKQDFEQRELEFQQFRQEQQEELDRKERELNDRAQQLEELTERRVASLQEQASLEVQTLRRQLQAEMREREQYPREMDPRLWEQYRQEELDTLRRYRQEWQQQLDSQRELAEEKIAALQEQLEQARSPLEREEIAVRGERTAREDRVRKEVVAAARAAKLALSDTEIFESQEYMQRLEEERRSLGELGAERPDPALPPPLQKKQPSLPPPIQPHRIQLQPVSPPAALTEDEEGEEEPRSAPEVASSGVSATSLATVEPVLMPALEGDAKMAGRPHVSPSQQCRGRPVGREHGSRDSGLVQRRARKSRIAALEERMRKAEQIMRANSKERDDNAPPSRTVEERFQGRRPGPPRPVLNPSAPRQGRSGSVPTRHSTARHTYRARAAPETLTKGTTLGMVDEPPPYEGLTSGNGTTRLNDSGLASSTHSHSCHSTDGHSNQTRNRNNDTRPPKSSVEPTMFQGDEMLNFSEWYYQQWKPYYEYYNGDEWTDDERAAFLFKKMGPGPKQHIQARIPGDPIPPFFDMIDVLIEGFGVEKYQYRMRQLFKERNQNEKDTAQHYINHMHWLHIRGHPGATLDTVTREVRERVLEGYRNQVVANRVRNALIARGPDPTLDDLAEVTQSVEQDIATRNHKAATEQQNPSTIPRLAGNPWPGNQRNNQGFQQAWRGNNNGAPRAGLNQPSPAPLGMLNSAGGVNPDQAPINYPPGYIAPWGNQYAPLPPPAGRQMLVPTNPGPPGNVDAAPRVPVGTGAEVGGTPNSGPAQSNNNNARGSAKSPAVGEGRPVCFNCHGVGHFARNCPMKPTAQVNVMEREFGNNQMVNVGTATASISSSSAEGIPVQSLPIGGAPTPTAESCWKCGGGTHRPRDCPVWAAEKIARYADFTCLQCGIHGHYPDECYIFAVYEQDEQPAGVLRLNSQPEN